MREIKFRAWNESVKEMTFFGDLVLTGDWENKMGMFFKATDGTVYMSKYSDPMQFTGLKDKNGVEIYEGDIVDDQFDVGQLKRIYYCDETASFMGEWLGFKSMGTDENYCSQISTCAETITGGTVIGNIHENTELLEDK